MLAPRKKLWATPLEVIEKAIELLNPSEDDIVFDIGAGNGRFLIECCKKSGAKCIGVEIEEERANEARENIKAADILEERCSVICGNALEQDYSSATKIFMYLTERGLRLIYPLLENIQHSCVVVTYMSPIHNCELRPEVLKVKTTQHPVGEWPLYLYRFEKP